MNNYSSVDSGIVALGMGFLLVSSIIVLAIAIIAIVGKWKMFTKAGEDGWKAIIPIYNTYIQCKIIGVNPWWILIVILSPILNIIPILGSLAEIVISVYFLILLCVSTANSYGKSTGYAVGLFFFQPIFECILGFGSAKYEGAKPMNDIIFKNNK